MPEKKQKTDQTKQENLQALDESKCNEFLHNNIWRGSGELTAAMKRVGKYPPFITVSATGVNFPSWGTSVPGKVGKLEYYESNPDKSHPGKMLLIDQFDPAGGFHILSQVIFNEVKERGKPDKLSMELVSPPIYRPYEYTYKITDGDKITDMNNMLMDHVYAGAQGLPNVDIAKDGVTFFLKDDKEEKIRGKVTLVGTYISKPIPPARTGDPSCDIYVNDGKTETVITLTKKLGTAGNFWVDKRILELPLAPKDRLDKTTQGSYEKKVSKNEFNRKNEGPLIGISDEPPPLQRARPINFNGPYG